MSSEVLGLRICGGALELGANYFVDGLTGEPHAELSIVDARVARGGPGTRGLLGLRQEADGRVYAWTGPQLASLSGDRFRLGKPVAISNADTKEAHYSLVLDFGSPRVGWQGEARRTTPRPPPVVAALAERGARVAPPSR